jgi:hypothetical protein
MRQIKSPTSRKRREKWGIQPNVRYGVTVMAAGGLTILPTEAVMLTVPPVEMPGTIETTPADTVASAVLLEVQVATLVTPWLPLQVIAVAVMLRVGLLPDTVPL